MKKEKETMKKENMNNKGFSLVELIIVIAIMAILLVVLAPQYLKYVERSRNSTDLQNATEMVQAIQVYAADPQNSDTPAAGDITVNNAGTTLGNSFIENALIDAGLADATSKKCATKCQSKTNWTSFTIHVNVSGDKVTFTYDDGNTTFARRMAGSSS